MTDGLVVIFVGEIKSAETDSEIGIGGVKADGLEV